MKEGRVGTYNRAGDQLICERCQSGYLRRVTSGLQTEHPELCSWCVVGLRIQDLEVDAIVTQVQDFYKDFEDEHLREPDIGIPSDIEALAAHLRDVGIKIGGQE